MWDYLEHVNKMLHGVVRVIKDLPKSEVVCLIISRRVESVTGYKKTVTSHRNVGFVTNQDGELIPDVFIYVFEGVLPLIKVWTMCCSIIAELIIIM